MPSILAAMPPGVMEEVGKGAIDAAFSIVKATLPYIPAGLKLLGKAFHVRDFLHTKQDAKVKKSDDAYEINKLRSRLNREKPLTKPEEVEVQGTFFPAILLAAAWWERGPRRKTTAEAEWKNGVQEWLFHGFEYWGPSWDLNSELQSGKSPVILGQLGEEDELNSLPILIPRDIARRLIDRLSDKDTNACQVKVRGNLWHRSQLPRNVRPELPVKWGKSFDYCIVLDEENSRHSIEPRPAKEKTPVYTAYLWQCLCPDDLLHSGRPPAIDQVYFAWEHTDFTKPDAVKYNIDALQHKVKYIQENVAQTKLTLLQQSSPIITPVDNSEPYYSREEFYDLILSHSRMCR